MFTEIRHDLYEEVSRVERITGSKEQRKIPVDHSEQMAGDYGQPPLERGGVITAERVRGPRDNGTHLVERGQPTSGGRLMPNHERSPMFDDHESAGSGQSIHKNSGPQSFNGGIMKEVEKGALGLPQDKMALIREKKDEIERVCQMCYGYFLSVYFISKMSDGQLPFFKLFHIIFDSDYILILLGPSHAGEC